MSQFGKFELLTCLAKGGMAEVFLARQTSEGRFERLLVIKRILPQHVDDQRFVDLFLEEARIAALLEHPNVIPVYDFGRVEDTYFIALPYVQGLTLSAMLRAAGEPPLEVACEIVRQTLLGLEYVHGCVGLDGEPLALVHRDISPSNLMVNEQGRVLLLDFGVASTSGSVTGETGSLRGKLAYMSPEQLAGDDLDHRSDLFSLGVVFFELLVGLRLFKRKSDLEVIRAITEEPIPDPRDYRPELPEEIVDVVLRALARDREDRFVSAAQFRGRLEAALAQLSLTSSESGLRDYLHHHLGEKLAEARRRAVDARAGELPGEAPTVVDVPRPGPRTRRGPRRLAALGVLALITLIVGGALVWLFAPQPTPAGPPLTMTFTPYLPEEVLQQAWAPVVSLMERVTDRPIETTVSVNYEEATDALVDGSVDLAELTGYPFLLALRRDKALQALATPISAKVKTYESYLVVRRGDPAKTLDDVRGRRICYVDRTSTSGYLMPRVMLREAGHDPDEFFASTQFSGNHFRALQDLIADRCDVAAVTSPAYLTARNEGIEVSRVRVLQVSPPLPAGVLCASSRLPAELIRRLREGLLSFDIQREIGRPTLSDMLPVTGFAPVDMRSFDELSREVELLESAEGNPDGGPSER